MVEAALTPAGNAVVLTGRLAEYRGLLEVLTERPGLTVVSADPWSGTSALLGAAVEELDGARVTVDARGSATSLDLAMAIADGAVSKLAPQALAWWTGAEPPSSTAGLRLARLLSQLGIDREGLRRGEGTDERRLSDALELLVALADGPTLLAIDHLGPMLASLRQGSRQLLGELRAARQRHPHLDLVLVEYTNGPAAKALADRGHPLYHAGASLRVRRAKPARFVEDLAITRPWTQAPVELIGAAAELAVGVPSLTWQIVGLAPAESNDAPARAFAGWRQLRRITDAPTARTWDLLRRIHPLAQTIVATIAVGLRPHAVAANSKRVNDALSRLREVGLAWQPETRRWALADPLLAAWVRDHPPPWAVRRNV